MDDLALDALGFDAIRTRLAAETAFAGGQALAASLLPSPDPVVVAGRVAETEEALYLAEHEPPELTGARDVRAAADRAARGGVLDPAALAEVAATSRVAAAVHRRLEDDPEIPRLAGRVATIEPGLSALAERIERAVEPDGSDLRDNATPALRQLRRDLATVRQRTADRLAAMAASPALQEHLQETFITERGGRPVLAVKATDRAHVPGIVHDASGSGQTLFVEPFAIVELSNRLRELIGAERDEVERILTELSAAAGAHGAALVDAVDVLSEIDLALARAALSRRWNGCRVELADGVDLRAARHPLLDPATAVPVDLPLEGLRAVIISGPNTGGKTVALKTVGLLALLHQSGLRVPAERARLPVFDRVLADIGDEQSIEQSLSTFSGHLRNLQAILAAAGPRTLVLLDEIGASTDPVEGAALAVAVLDRLVDQAALTMAATHSAEVKEWAGATAAVENAAAGFDPETLQPTYSLRLGRPGASHALEIAERLGLERELLAAARANLGAGRAELERLLADAARAERDAQREREEAAAARSTMEGARAAAEARAHELEAAVEALAAGARDARERVRAEAAAEAEAELAAALREVEALRDEVRAARRAEAERRAAGEAVEGGDDAARERDRRLGAADERARAARQVLRAAAAPLPVARGGPLAAGDPVVAPALGVRGTIVSVSGDAAEVQGGRLRVRVPLAELEPDPTGGRISRPEPPVVIRATAPVSVERELDVRGRRADEAREAVRAFVDAAHLAGADEVRVIHGRGTGAVRAAVRDELARHPLVEDQQADSADGATDVRIAPNAPAAR